MPLSAQTGPHVKSCPIQCKSGQTHAEPSDKSILKWQSRKYAQTPHSQRRIWKVCCSSRYPVFVFWQANYVFRPIKGSLSESRGFIATQHVCREMLELCEIINQYGEFLFSPSEKQNDPRKVISFGALFNVSIQLKLHGNLLTTTNAESCHWYQNSPSKCIIKKKNLLWNKWALTKPC